PQCDAVGHAAVAVVELAECAVVTARHERDQRLVREVREVGHRAQATSPGRLVRMRAHVALVRPRRPFGSIRTGPGRRANARRPAAPTSNPTPPEAPPRGACSRTRSRRPYNRRVPIAELTRNAVDVLPQGGLEAKLKLGRPLRVKLGIDVTSPDIHVGRGIPLQRMRAFQDEGHTGVLIVGDYTTRIGDPSGRSAERPILSDEEIDDNAQSYLDQALLILDPARTEVRRNGEWLSQLTFADVVRLTRT